MSGNPHSAPPDQAQRELIDRELTRCLLVEAAAGTGKTTKMVDRLLALLAAGSCRVESIAAVTFTRKAASELRGRFVAALERRAAASAEPQERARLAAALGSLDRCFIGTIHSFCARLLRERPVEAGVRVGFEEADDETDERVMAEAWQEFLAGIYAADSPWLDRLEALGLEPSVLESAYRNLCRFGDLGDDAWPAPEVPLTGSAAVIAELRRWCAHFDSLDLPEDTGNDELIPTGRLVTRLVRARDLDEPAGLAEVLEAFKKVKTVQKIWPGKKAQAGEELERWETFRSEHAAPWLERWRAHRYQAALGFALEGRKAYRGLLESRGLLSYQDLLCRAAALLRDNPAVRRYFRARFSHVLVDEFQDTDPLQAEVLLLLTATDPQETDWRRCVPAPGSLFVVGDPKQSIYRFRRADIVTYNQVRGRIEAAGGLRVALSANFRSDPEIIGWVNGAFEEAFAARAGDCSPEWMPLLPGRQPESPGELSGIRALRLPKEVSQITRVESLQVARFIRQAVDSGAGLPRTAAQLERGVPPAAKPGDFLIITRNRKHLRDFAAALESVGLPCAATGGGALDRVEELKMLHLALSALVRPDDPVRLAALLRSAAFGLSDRELYAFVRAGGRFDYRRTPPAGLEPALRDSLAGIFDTLKECALWLRQLPVVAAFHRIAARLGLFASAVAAGGGDMQAGSLARALELVRAVGREGLAAAVERLGELAYGKRQEESLSAAGAGGPAVRLMNLHQAKGLEAPVVFLADPSGADSGGREPEVHVDRGGGNPRGYLLISESYGPYASRPVACHPDWETFAAREKQFLEAEHLRLLYVAATRAGSMLVVTQRASYNNRNPWNYFAPVLEGAAELPAPGPQAGEAGPAAAFTLPDPIQAETEIQAAWSIAAQPSYDILAARKKAGVTGEDSYVASGSGAEFGSVVHQLLQAAMAHPGADLHNLARAVLREQELEQSRLESAIETVRAVVGSPLWARARAASLCLTEAPFTVLAPDSPPGRPQIVRGQIDLLFRESAGWVIVDYKTERPGAAGFGPLVERHAPQVRLYADYWRRMTGEPVAECGLFFTGEGTYIKI
ncbi:UvrD-helicase domain-containing protein [bacterium]|nr:UvrD-helicase domain-containing protein [bacterium]